MREGRIEGGKEGGKEGLRKERREGLREGGIEEGRVRDIKARQKVRKISLVTSGRRTSYA